MRITKSNVRGMFTRLVKAMGKKEGPILINDNADGVDHFPGGLMLDYAPIYGGYVIEQEEENGGISNPFGSTRRSAKEMYLSMSMTAQALEDLKYHKKEMNKLEW